MGRLRRMWASLLLVTPIVSGAAVVEVAAPVDAVTVYPGRVATVERVARFQLSPGSHELVVTGLSTEIDADSVRLEIEQGEGLRLGPTEVRREPVAGAAREREAALREQLAELHAQRAAAEDRKATAQTRLSFVEGLAELPRREGAPSELAGADAAERWPQLWQTIARGADAARAEIRAAASQMERLDEQMEAVRRKIDALGRSRRESVRMRSRIEASASGDVSVRLLYRVSGPDWQPAYEARLDSGAGRVQLIRAASIRQATGTDWSDIRLSLATTRPVRGDVPELPPWWIDFRAESQARQAASGAGLQAAEGLAARSATPTSAEFAATYRIPGRVSVPASNERRLLQIGSETLMAEAGIRVVPQQDRRAWLVADAVWEGGAALPAGELARYRDGSFVGSTRLAAWPPGKSRSLAFGTDPRFEVDFQRLKDEGGEQGLLRKETTRVRHYRLRMVNRHQRALPVTVRFRVPVPRNERINVESWFPVAPSASDVDQRVGVHEWTLAMEPGAPKELDLGYRITFPEGKQVPGF